MCIYKLVWTLLRPGLLWESNIIRYKVRILPCCPAAAAAGDDRKNTFKRNRSRPLYL